MGTWLCQAHFGGFKGLFPARGTEQRGQCLLAFLLIPLRRSLRVVSCQGASHDAGASVMPMANTYTPPSLSSDMITCDVPSGLPLGPVLGTSIKDKRNRNRSHVSRVLLISVFGLDRTTSPNIYACGDCASPYKFTHAADWQVRNERNYPPPVIARHGDPTLAHVFRYASSPSICLVFSVCIYLIRRLDFPRPSAAFPCHEDHVSYVCEARSP